MKSTRAFLEYPYKPTDLRHHERHKQLENLKGRPIDIPEVFQCEIQGELMDKPCNLKLKDCADDYYVDLSVVHQLKMHPITNTKIKLNSTVDTTLIGRINALLTIEELSYHVTHVEAMRRSQISTQLNNLPAIDVVALLAFHSKDIFQSYNCEDLPIPKDFLSALTHTLMTLPVMIDGVVIDFFELLATQPARKKSHHNDEEKRQALTEYQEKQLLKLTADYERNLDSISRNIYHETEVIKKHEPAIDQVKLKNVPELIALQSDCYLRKTEEVMRLTFESICTLTLHEYINPFTDKPIEHFALRTDLLASIDHFLDQARLHNMLKPIYKQMAKYDQLIRRANPRHADKTYMAILEEAELSAASVPDTLLVASEPGTAFTIIPTDPVILDGSYTTDFKELLAYWKKTTWGLNPATALPIHSITYDAQLKDDATKFVINLPFYKASASEFRRCDDKQKNAGVWGFFTGSSATAVKGEHTNQPSNPSNSK